MLYVVNAELYHHGILGQKWGKRNGPPYPLGASDHSASEKKAGWRKSIRSNPDLKEKKNQMNAAWKEYSKAYDEADRYSWDLWSPNKARRAAQEQRLEIMNNAYTAYQNSRKDYKNLKSQLRADRQREIEEYEKTLPKDRFGLNSAQKKRCAEVMIGTASALGVGAAIYFGYKSGAIDAMSELYKSGDLTLENAKKVMDKTLDDTVQILKSSAPKLEETDNGDYIFKKGDVLHRMSAYANVDYSNATKPLYTAFKTGDVASYMFLLKDWHGTGERYDVTLETLKDLRIPSEHKAREMFEEIWDKDSEYRKKLFDTVTEAYTKIGTPQDLAEAIVRKDLGKDPFKVAIYSMVKSKEDTKQWIKKLQDYGYDAIIDYFDKGTMADAPLIVLDPANALQKTGERFVTKSVKREMILKLQSEGITKLPGTGISVGGFGPFTLSTYM